MGKGNHANRGPVPTVYSNPKPGEVRRMRESLGLTIAQAADIVRSTPTAWEAWEEGERRMHPGLAELFRLKTQAEEAA